MTSVVHNFSGTPHTGPDGLAALRREFTLPPGFLDAATMGLPPQCVVDSMQHALDQWQSGQASPDLYDGHVQRSRAKYASLLDVPAEWVATGSQTSVFAGMVASSVPDGAEVLCVEGDFSSMTYPFVVQARSGRITMRSVPSGDLAAAITDSTHMVVFSLCQSANGELLDGAAIAGRAVQAGALTFCDVTQAAGWLPIDASRYDLTVCSAYKWLCQPRGTAYLTARPGVAEQLIPVNAGWYAGEVIWDSCYGDTPAFASSSRRFDVSPAWLCWVGAEAALDLFATVPMEDIHEHDLGLANRVRAAVGMQPYGSPIVAIPDPDGEAITLLRDNGIRASWRAGSTRLAFHLWNSEQECDLVAGILAARTPRALPAPTTTEAGN